MAILDTTIVAVALPTLAKDFHVTVNTIQWVTTGYLLALAVVIPLSGWAMHRFGGKPVYMTSSCCSWPVPCSAAWPGRPRPSSRSGSSRASAEA